MLLFWAIAGPFFLAMYIDSRHVAKDETACEWLLYASAGVLATVSAEVLFSFAVENSRPQIRDHLAREGLNESARSL